MCDENIDQNGDTGGKSDLLDRRNVLRTLGTGAAVTALGLGNAAAKARTGASRSEIPWTFVEIEGGAKESLRATLAETPEYERLLDVVSDRDGELTDESEAARLVANGRVREVVSIAVESESDAELFLNVGRDPGEGVSVANVTEKHYADDGVLRKQVVYDVLSDADADTSTTPGVSIRSTDGAATKKVVHVEDEIRDAIERAKTEVESEHDDRASTQGLGDGPCDECKWAAVLICQNGCGLAGGLACGLLGITAIGGVACTTLVGVTCALAAYYSCSETEIGEAACEEVNLC